MCYAMFNYFSEKKSFSGVGALSKSTYMCVAPFILGRV